MTIDIFLATFLFACFNCHSQIYKLIQIFKARGRCSDINRDENLRHLYMRSLNGKNPLLHQRLTRMAKITKIMKCPLQAGHNNEQQNVAARIQKTKNVHHRCDCSLPFARQPIR
jgi:hypothetical protein